MPVSLDTIKTKVLGKTFGKLTILEYAGRSLRGDNLWKSICSCGTHVIGNTSQLTKSNSGCTKCKIASGPGRTKYTTYLLNEIFERLTVTEYAGKNKYNESMWKCECSCGNEIVTRASSLLTGVTRSCGCYKRDQTRERNTRHGLHKHPLYGVWWAMKQRCLNPNCSSYKNYGGRTESLPIGVCDEWNLDFMAFYNWAMVNGYQSGLTIERKNNDGDYEPGNCRWATDTEQSQNTRRTKMSLHTVLAIRNDPRVHSAIARDYNVDESTISRIKMRMTWKNIA